MKDILLTLNKPNLNGRIYPSEVVEDALRRFKESGKPLVVQSCSSGADINLETVIGTIENIEVNGDELLGVIKLFPEVEMLNNITARPTFIGKFKEGTSEVSEIELISFTLTNDPA